MSYEDDKIAKQPELPVKFNIIPKTVLKPFTKNFIGYDEGLVRSEPNGFVMSPWYSQKRLRSTTFCSSKR